MERSRDDRERISSDRHPPHNAITVRRNGTQHRHASANGDQAIGLADSQPLHHPWDSAWFIMHHNIFQWPREVERHLSRPCFFKRLRCILVFMSSKHFGSRGVVSGSTPRHSHDGIGGFLGTHGSCPRGSLAALSLPSLWRHSNISKPVWSGENAVVARTWPASTILNPNSIGIARVRGVARYMDIGLLVPGP